MDNPHFVPCDRMLLEPPVNADALAMFCVGIPDAKNRRSTYRRTGWTLRALVVAGMMVYPAPDDANETVLKKVFRARGRGWLILIDLKRV